MADIQKEPPKLTKIRVAQRLAEMQLQVARGNTRRLEIELELEKLDENQELLQKSLDETAAHLKTL